MSTNSIATPAQAGVKPEVTSHPKRYHPALVALHWAIAILIFGAFFLSQGNEGEGRGRFRPGQGGNFPPQGFQQGGGNQQPFQGGDDEGAPQGFQPQIVSPGSQPNGNQQFQGDGNESPQGFPGGNFPGQTGSQSIFSTIGIHMIFGLVVLVLLIIRLIVRWTTKHPDWATAGNKFFDWIGVLTHWGLYLLTFAMVITGIVLADQRGILARTFGIGSTPTPGSFGRGGFGRGGFSIGFLHGGVWALLVLLMALHIGAALYHQFIIKDNLLARMWFGKKEE